MDEELGVESGKQMHSHRTVLRYFHSNITDFMVIVTRTSPRAWWAPQAKGTYQMNAGETHDWTPAPLPEAVPYHVIVMETRIR